jgi:hypothetical protein
MKSTNEGRPLVLGTVIRALPETDARIRERMTTEMIARAKKTELERKVTGEDEEVAQAKKTKAERRVTFVDEDVALAETCEEACGASSTKEMLDCGTQTPTVSC